MATTTLPEQNKTTDAAARRAAAEHAAGIVLAKNFLPLPDTATPATKHGYKSVSLDEVCELAFANGMNVIGGCLKAAIAAGVRDTDAFRLNLENTFELARAALTQRKYRPETLTAIAEHAQTAVDQLANTSGVGDRLAGLRGGNATLQKQAAAYAALKS